jgi:hypothetical protein
MPILNFFVYDEANNNRIMVSYNSSITFGKFALDFLKKHGYYPISLDTDDYIFSYGAKILNNHEYINKALKELIIEKMEIRFIKINELKLAGGFSIGIDNKAAQDEEILIKGNYNKDAPQWNVITKGLNMSGKCENNSCEAYNKIVDCQIGLGIFDANKDYDKIKCPMCKNKVHPIACYFCKCQYKIEGKKFNKCGEEIQVSKPWKAVEKDFEYYDPKKKGISDWLTLIIETKPL